MNYDELCKTELTEEYVGKSLVYCMRFYNTNDKKTYYYIGSTMCYSMSYFGSVSNNRKRKRVIGNQYNLEIQSGAKNIDKFVLEVLEDSLIRKSVVKSEYEHQRRYNVVLNEDFVNASYATWNGCSLGYAWFNKHSTESNVLVSPDDIDNFMQVNPDYVKGIYRDSSFGLKVKAGMSIKDDDTKNAWISNWRESCIANSSWVSTSSKAKLRLNIVNSSTGLTAGHENAMRSAEKRVVRCHTEIREQCPEVFSRILVHRKNISYVTTIFEERKSNRSRAKRLYFLISANFGTFKYNSVVYVLLVDTSINP